MATLTPADPEDCWIVLSGGALPEDTNPSPASPEESGKPSLLLPLYEPHALLVIVVFALMLCVLEVFCSLVVKELVVRATPFRALFPRSSTPVGLSVCEAVDGGIFLTAGLAHGSLEGSAPKESCRGLDICLGVAGAGDGEGSLLDAVCR